MASTNNETVHISLGNTANHITSHLLNLQGLAATSSKHDSSGDNNEELSSSSLCLCDPSVTHDIAPLDSDYYSTYATGGSSASSRYMYVPRVLIVDGRDAFGSAWGGVSYNDDGINQYQPSPTSMSYSPNILSQNDPNVHITSWGGKVSIFDASYDRIFGENQQQENDDRQQQVNERGDEEDPLDRFRSAASNMGLSPQYSRFNATLPSSYNAGGGNSASSRHVQWDEEEEEDEEDDDYCYGHDNERIEEEKRRRMERMEYQKQEVRRNWNASMEDAWEETFYGGGGDGPTSRSNGVTADANTATTSMSSHSNNDANITTIDTDNRQMEREIQWYDYFMPPRPSPSKYQVPLPFDTAASINNNGRLVDSWSTSFNLGYHPSSGGAPMSGIGGGSDSAGITHSWREHALSESLRKVLEGCDVVKGFNIFVDGGNFAGLDCSSSMPDGENKYAKLLSSIMAGGGFHAGLATSLLEELSEECRSAGRWAVMVDPLLSSSNNTGNGSNGSTEGSQVNHFRRCVNAGLALHGLSSNADAFLPVSVDGAYRALRGKASGGSPNRTLFEGSAAVSLALETSTLFYRLHRQPPASSSSHSGARSRIGIQSGFYQGYSGNVGCNEANEPYASAPSLTYHEFLACARPSSDKRRSILELDALLHPLSYPSVAGDAMGAVTSGFNAASLLSGGASSSSVLASLASAGLISGGSNTLGELQKRMMRGTSIERMMMEQQQQQRYRSSRGSSFSSRPKEPGEWLEDNATTASGGGGLLSSLSGNSTPFGRRSDHHHFALSSSLRPAASDVRSFTDVNSIPGGCGTSAFLRPMMESMGVKYRPEVSLGAVVKDSVVELTGAGSYWRAVFTERTSSTSTSTAASGSANPSQQQQQDVSPRDIASHTPILSVLGNSTRSYPRLGSISTGFVDALHSRRNMGYLSRDAMAGIIPEKDDCEEALEYCQELVDVYEPPLGSGLVMGEDENADVDAYFDENED